MNTDEHRLCWIGLEFYVSFPNNRIFMNPFSLSVFIRATNDLGFRNVPKFFRSKIVHDRISLNAECAETQRFAEKDK